MDALQAAAAPAAAQSRLCYLHLLSFVPAAAATATATSAPCAPPSASWPGLAWLKCHQRKNKWQQFSINCICAKLSSILASAAHAACSMQHAAYSMWQVASPVGSSSSSIRCAPSRCWSSQTPLTLQLATITFSRPSLVCLVTSRARTGDREEGRGRAEGAVCRDPGAGTHRLLVFAPDRL